MSVKFDVAGFGKGKRPSGRGHFPDTAGRAPSSESRFGWGKPLRCHRDFPLKGDGWTREGTNGVCRGPDWDRYYQAVVKGWKEALRNLKAFLES